MPHKKQKMELQETLCTKIMEIFTESQHTAATHQKFVVIMKKLLGKTNDDIFFEAMLEPMQKVLCTEFKQKNEFVDRVAEFIALFCSTLKPDLKEDSDDDIDDCEEHPLLTKIIDYLLLAQKNVLDKVRFRACQLIIKILNHLVGVEVSSEFCNKLEENLLERLRDPKSVIRMQAVISLHRLQDPTNPDDRIINEFNHLLKSDHFSKVRQLCVEKIAIKRETVPQIVSRIRDVDANVRLAAFKRLSKIPDVIKIADRRMIIHTGFIDSSEKIVDYIKSTFIPLWLEHYQNNIIDLMKSIRLDADERDIEETTRLVELVLPTFFKDRPLSELTKVLPLNNDKLIPLEQLDWETINYWRIYVQFLNSREEFEVELGLVLPELVYFSKYILNYYERCPADLTSHEFLLQQFILKQMFLMTKGYDYADPSSRKALNDLIFKILEKATLTTELVEIIVSNLENSIPNTEKRSLFVTEIIAEIISPMNPEQSYQDDMERNYKISNLKVQLHNLSDLQKDAIESQNFSKAGELKLTIDELQAQLVQMQNDTKDSGEVVEKRSDPPTIAKYLDIAAGLLLSTQITQMTPALQSLQNDVIQEMLMHKNDAIKAKALRCYALSCTIDRDSAKNGIHIFSTPIFAYQQGEECDTLILMVCIGAVVDLIRIYGSKLIAEPQEEILSESTDEEHVRIFSGGTSLTDLIQGLVDLMDDENVEIQLMAGRALCSLILSERVQSASLISRLILKWCSPASDEDEPGLETLKQLIGFTLQQIPSVVDNADQLEGAVLLTVKALSHAPRVSPLADVNIENIVKFMLALCRTTQQNEQIQRNLARKICCEMLDKPKSKMTIIYSKILCFLDLPQEESGFLELLKLSEEIRDELQDKTSIANITKFMAQLTKKRIEVSSLQESNNSEPAVEASTNRQNSIETITEVDEEMEHAPIEAISQDV
ncbi:unnamed protein product [Brassicogethes aeneus]|uniref:Nuclear condensin complex subunit 3 C-terminal domain-containing protein n=1 Tax=Brassicogethes aeneus TaxID=1431903 RepID=A0A9P0ATD1_BRAAE|nr:unnamed protein product [Brassicogethes aeneus]